MSDISASTWSATDASNTTAAPDGAPEGMASGMLGGAAAIALLGFPVGPAAVFRAVRSVVVDAVKGHSRRALAHVSEERHEIAVPFLAHGNSTPAVVFEADMVRITAPLPHPAPKPVGIGSGQAVNDILGDSQFAHKTTTGSGVSAAEMRGRDGSAVPAIAEAEPFDLNPAANGVLAFDRQATESLSGKINLFHPMIVPTKAGGCNE